MGGEIEAAVLASLIGLLWRAREGGAAKVQVSGAEHDTKPQPKKRGGLFKKSWNNVKDEDVVR